MLVWLKNNRSYSCRLGINNRLPKELALEGITDMEAANTYLNDVFISGFNKTFTVVAAEEGDAFVPLLSISLKDILCLKAERTVGPVLNVNPFGRFASIKLADWGG
jgi:hypothetical protein